LDEPSRGSCFARLLETAAELGAKVICAIADDPDEKRLTQSLAELCDAAAPYGLAVGVEFMPYSRVRDANSALRIVRQACRSNARIIVDALHAHRSNTTSDDLAAIPPELLSHAQLCDAPAEAPSTREGLIHAARYTRLLPGAGAIDLRALVRALPEGLPLSIEVPNAEQVALLGAEEWARRALSSAQLAL
jgi:sugar phosphate isomerase/epimerase